MEQYRESFAQVKDFGLGRNGGTFSQFGTMQQYDLNKGFPLLGLKDTNYDAILKELLWMLSGSSDNRVLTQGGVKIWNLWDVIPVHYNTFLERLKESEGNHLVATLDKCHTELYTTVWPVKLQIDVTDFVIMAALSCGCNDESHIKLTRYLLNNTLSGGKNVDDRRLESLLYSFTKVVNKASKFIDWRSGDLGPVYGKMFRDFNGVDQLANFEKGLITEPYSRRHIIDLWNPALEPDAKLPHYLNILLGKQVLPPCHVLIQGNVRRTNLLEAFNYVIQYSPINHSEIWLRSSNDEEVLKRILTSDKDKELIECRTKFIVATINHCDETMKTLYLVAYLKILYGEDIMEKMYKDFNVYLDTLCDFSKKHNWQNLPEDYYDESWFKANHFDLLFFMRSNDKPIGQPYNIAFYATLMEMVCHITGYKKGVLTQMSGNAHFYNNQIDGSIEMLTREDVPLPELTIKQRGQTSLTDFVVDDFELIGYTPNKFIKIPVSA